jgi:DhnA family fructose-bisphosphate aldolase class Ia
MSESLESRLDKILPGGRGVWIPLDHGISQYPEEGLENMDETIGQLIDSQVDAIIIHKGVLSYQKKLEIGVTLFVTFLHQRCMEETGREKR